MERTTWYMGDDSHKERREILDYYYSVKAEEKDTDKELIKRFYLDAPAVPKGQAFLLAYVCDYRRGRFVVDTNPVYNLGRKGDHVDENSGGK